MYISWSNAAPYPQLPQRVMGLEAHRLHALLRYCPGYREACGSPRRIAWVTGSILQLVHHDLPLGCRDAARSLQEALPFFAPKLTRQLSMDQICKILVEAGRYCAYRNVEVEAVTREQAGRRPVRVGRELGE